MRWIICWWELQKSVRHLLKKQKWVKSFGNEQWKTSWWLNNIIIEENYFVISISSLRIPRNEKEKHKITMTMYQWDVNEWGANAPIGHTWLWKRYVEPLGGQCAKQMVLAIEYLCAKIIPRSVQSCVYISHTQCSTNRKHIAHINTSETKQKDRTLNIDIHLKTIYQKYLPATAIESLKEWSLEISLIISNK